MPEIATEQSRVEDKIGDLLLPQAEQKLSDLLSIFASGRLPHALLINGRAGSGKYDLARELIWHVLKQSARSANLQKAETLLLAGSHPDYHEVTTEEDKKSISINQIRDISNILSKTPQLGSYKTALIHPADLMTAAAANALLKTLEEPPGNSLIVLLSDNKGWLPQTIRSRCHIIDLPVPSHEEAIAWLQGKVDDPEFCLSAADGIPGLALRAQQTELTEAYETFLIGMSDLSRQKTDPLSLAKTLKVVPLENLLGWLGSLIQALIRAKLTKENTLINSNNQLNNIDINIENISVKQLFEFQEFLQQAKRLKQANLNVDLFLEEIFMRWAGMVSPVR